MDENVEKRTKINKAPNLLLILLWHHFCFYKRHRILLVATLLMPFVLLSVLYVLSYEMSSTDKSSGRLARMQKYLPCQSQTTPMMTSGPFHYSNLHDCKSKNFLYTQGSTCADSGHQCQYPSQHCVNETIYVEQSLSDQKPFCPLSSSSSWPSTCRCGDLNHNPYYDMCSWLRGYVVYYPNNSQIVHQVMTDVKKKIDFYGRNLKSIVNTSQIDFQSEIDNWPINDLQQLSQYAQCFQEAEQRVLGFATRQEMLQYVKYMNDSFDYDTHRYRYEKDPPQILWAALNFERITDDDQKSFRYSFMRERSSRQSPEATKSIYIQDLIESAFVKSILKIDKPPLVPMFKELPSKCWVRPTDAIYAMMTLMLPMICVAGFLFSPVNFLEQVITEKQLKLREYLSIMGVSDVILKLSWILFYMLFVIPASIGAAIYVRYLYGGVMAKSDLSILVVQFILFNLSQLFLSYFLSSFLKEPKRVAFYLGFLTMLPSSFATCAFFFSGSQLHGALLIVFRILSLHCAVPFVISLSYVVNWESIWVGAQWSNAFATPNLTDGYSGFGEGIMWMVGDCFLYLLAAWYLQNVMPGEYGIKRKFYFFLQPSYWMPKKFGAKEIDLLKSFGHLELDQLEPDLEPRNDQDNRSPTVIIDRLTKFYNRQKMGVDRLSLSVYRNEITALLGQNGAGKSTTMNTLVGLLSPTAGRFTVAGLDGANQMTDIKKLLGFVPQYDILYPSMNVEEHLQFFGWLKGLDKQEIKTTVYPLLDKFGMSHLKTTMTTSLSGGQKRKLSILTAYLGDPELVILDEPTTGVDPFSRRSIWDVLLHYRLSTATIVSTHFMDEADLLSDRIAVISEGTLRCVGSPMYLKNKYGQGFRVIAACNNQEDSIEKTKDFISDHQSGITLTQISGRDLTFTVPKEYSRSHQMIDLLKSIEDNRSKIGISSFGISEPTLEEAFFAAAEIDTHKQKETDEHQDRRELVHRASSAKLRYTNRSGIRLWFNQLVALLRKRAILAWRTPSVIAMQILLPMAYIVILLLTSNELMQSNQAKTTPIHIYQKYRSNVLFFQDKTPGSSTSDQANDLLKSILKNGFGPRCSRGIDGFPCDRSKSIDKPIDNQIIDLATTRDQGCTDCNKYCREGGARQVQHWTIPSMDTIYDVPKSMNAIDWVLAANQSDHWVVGGFQFYTHNYTLNNNRSSSNLGEELATSTPDSYVVIWTRQEMKMAMLNVFNNLLIQTYSNSSDQNSAIEVSFEDIHFPNPQDDDPKSTNITDLINSLVGTFLLTLAFTYATFGIAVSVQQEKSANLKELQYVSGAKPSAYWLANFVWDFLQYLLTLAVIMFFMGVCNNGLKSHLNAYVNILIPYGMGAIGFIYLISFRFKSSNAVNKVIIITGLLSIAVGFMICQFEYSNFMYEASCKSQASGTPDDCDGSPFPWAKTAGYILRIIPYYLLADGCYVISLSTALNSISSGPAIDLFDKDILGKRLAEGYIMAFIWLFLLIIIENGLNGLFYCKSKSKPNVEHGNENETYNQDPDVKEEERRVLQTEKSEEPVVVKQVTKKYPKASTPAVDSVTFSIPRSQCFGLLGVNGAGKTSLFRIMTGFQPPTNGQALIEGKNVVSAKSTLSTNISYCPQENTLFDNLSVREHLRLFASLRGVPRAHVQPMVEGLIDEVGLEAHSHKLAGQLSGGNKRKLNFALALLDYKPVIFLDEPTSGMDPGARRRTWTCIQSAIQRGCSVVLTSHSMDECEALCHRLVIMARGKICCIGSIQYLKDKFGNRYTIKIKLTSSNDRSEDQSNKIDQLKQFVQRSIPESHLLEEHGTMLQYETGASTNGLRLSSLFGAMSECRRLFPDLIEDFTLSQVTLERVFVSMAQKQQDQSQNPNQEPLLVRNENQHNSDQNVNQVNQEIPLIENVNQVDGIQNGVTPIEIEEHAGVSNGNDQAVAGRNNHRLSISHK